MQDNARCILVMPDWQSKAYWRLVQRLRLAEVYYPPVTQVFESDEKAVRGTMWGTWAYLLDGSLVYLPDLEDVCDDEESESRTNQPKTPGASVAGVGAGIRNCPAMFKMLMPMSPLLSHSSAIPLTIRL